MQKQMKLWKQFWAHRTFENIINKLWNQGDNNQMPLGGTAVPPVQPLSPSHGEPSFHSAGPGSREYRANACLLLHTGSQGGSIWKTQNERANSPTYDIGPAGDWVDNTWKPAPWEKAWETERSFSKNLGEVHSFSRLLFAYSTRLRETSNYITYLQGFHNNKFKIILRGKVLIVKCYRACMESRVEHQIFSKDPLVL